MNDSTQKYENAAGNIQYMTGPQAAYTVVPTVQYGTDAQVQYVGQLQPAISNEAITMAKLDGSLTNLEEQQMTIDPRYTQMIYLKQKLSGE